MNSTFDIKYAQCKTGLGGPKNALTASHWIIAFQVESWPLRTMRRRDFRTGSQASTLFPAMSGPDPNPDTIAAVSTPPGRGGIGIVRLSGPQAASIAAQLVSLHKPLEHAHARLADVLDSAGSDASRIDEALVTWFAAPNSYTAEDVVEISAHGSPVVLGLLLRRAVDLGARLAEPGEFTQQSAT
jgi:hypothetical protein